jgi:hypothetical protein
MTAARRPALIAVWAVLVAVIAGIAVARLVDNKVHTGAAASTTTTAVVLQGSGPGPSSATDGAAGAGQDGTGGAGTGDGGGTAPADGGGGAGGGGEAPVPDRTMPLPGTYTLATAPGSKASINGAPQAVPAQSQMLIEQLSETDQRVTSPGSAGDFVAQLRYAPAEVDLVSLTFGPKSFQPDPPVMFAPVGAPQGTTWQWSCSSTDGKTTIAAAGRTVGTETLTVAGQSVDTEIVDLVLTLTGDVVGTLRLTLWVRPGDHLPVRQHQVTDISDSTKLVFHLTSDVTAQLVDLSPT